MTLSEALENPWGNPFLAGLAESAERRGFLTSREREAAVRVAGGLALADELAVRHDAKGIPPRAPDSEARYFSEIEQAIAESREYSIRLALEADNETGLVWWAGMPRKPADGDLPKAYKVLDIEDRALSVALLAQRIPMHIIRDSIDERGREVIEAEGPGAVLNSLRACARRIYAKWAEVKRECAAGRWSEETFDWR